MNATKIPTRELLMVPELKRKEGTKKIDDETFPSNFNTAIIKLPEEEWFTYTSQLFGLVLRRRKNTKMSEPNEDCSCGKTVSLETGHNPQLRWYLW